MKYVLYISLLVVLVSLGQQLFWTPSSDVKNSQLECAKRQQLAVDGDVLAKDEANRFCKLADTQLDTVKKSIGKL